MQVNKPLRAKLSAAATTTAATSLLLGDALVLLRGLLGLFPGATLLSKQQQQQQQREEQEQGERGGAASRPAAAGEAGDGSSPVELHGLVRAVLEPFEEQVSSG
jgi:hypothetical protein